MSEATRRRRGARAVAVAVGFILLFAGCARDRSPTIDDFPDEAFIVFPGATKLEQTFRPQEVYRPLDTGTSSTPAVVTIRYRAPESTSLQQVHDWYEARWGERGWKVVDHDNIRVDPLQDQYRKAPEDIDSLASGGALSFRGPLGMEPTGAPNEFQVSAVLPSPG